MFEVSSRAVPFFLPGKGLERSLGGRSSGQFFFLRPSSLLNVDPSFPEVFFRYAGGFFEQAGDRLVSLFSGKAGDSLYLGEADSFFWMGRDRPSFSFARSVLPCLETPPASHNAFLWLNNQTPLSPLQHGLRLLKFCVFFFSSLIFGQARPLLFFFSFSPPLSETCSSASFWASLHPPFGRRH